MKFSVRRLTYTRAAAIVGALFVLLPATGCGSGGATSSDAAPGEADSAAGRIEALQKNTSVPPQVKEEMLRNLRQQQSQQAAGAAKKQ
jgi:hypothetical protein